jgi:hypothetical protein
VTFIKIRLHRRKFSNSDSVELKKNNKALKTLKYVSGFKSKNFDNFKLNCGHEKTKTYSHNMCIKNEVMNSVLKCSHKKHKRHS